VMPGFEKRFFTINRKRNDIKVGTKFIPKKIHKKPPKNQYYVVNDELRNKGEIAAKLNFKQSEFKYMLKTATDEKKERNFFKANTYSFETVDHEQDAESVRKLLENFPDISFF